MAALEVKFKYVMKTTDLLCKEGRKKVIFFSCPTTKALTPLLKLSSQIFFLGNLVIRPLSPSSLSGPTTEKIPFFADSLRPISFFQFLLP